MFTNECLGEIEYEGTTAAIFMGGLFLTFLVEYITHRIANRFISKKPTEVSAAPIVGKADSATSSVSTVPERQHEVIGVMVLEAGIIFHSISTSPQ